MVIWLPAVASRKTQAVQPIGNVVIWRILQIFRWCDCWIFLDENVPHDESASKYSGGVIVEFFMMKMIPMMKNSIHLKKILHSLENFFLIGIV